MAAMTGTHDTETLAEWAAGEAGLSWSDAVRDGLLASAYGAGSDELFIPTLKLQADLPGVVATSSTSYVWRRNRFYTDYTHYQDFFFFDGSGLSNQDLITPRAATTLLAYASRQPWGASWRSTMPVAGVDGTLSSRFTHSPVKGRLDAKTGTLGEVRGLSGYLTTTSGRTLAISILVNDHQPDSKAESKAMDQLVEMIWKAE